MLNKKRYIQTLYTMLKTCYKTVKILYIIYNVKKLFKNIYTLFYYQSTPSTSSS